MDLMKKWFAQVGREVVLVAERGIWMGIDEEVVKSGDAKLKVGSQ